MALRSTAPRFTTSLSAIPRCATVCAVAALAIGLAGCAATSEPARTAQRTAAATRAPEANTGDALARIARQSLEAGDPASAVSMLKRAHEMSPGSAAILAELGRTLSVLKAWQESAQAYAKAAEIDPKDPAIRRGHAAALLALDLPTIAEQEYRAALALREDAPTLSGLGVTLDLQGRHDDALTAFRRALELDPEGAATRTNLGLSLALWGSSDEAIGLLAPMAAASTASARQRQNLALVFGLAGDLDQARAVAKMDLPEEAVRNNLAYYETLRGLTPILRMRAMMGTHAVAAAGGLTTTVSADSAVPAAKPVDAVPPTVEPVKPSRAAERAPMKKAKPASVASEGTKPEAPSARVATPDVAVSTPMTPASADAPATGGSDELARDIAAEAATIAAAEPNIEEVAFPAASPASNTTSVETSPSAESEMATAPKAESQPSHVAAVRAIESGSPSEAAPSDGAGIAGTASDVATKAPEQNKAEGPVENPASVTDAAAVKPAADTAETPATPAAPVADAATAVEPAAAMPEATGAAAADDAFEGANYGATETAVPSFPRQEARLPADALPQVSVRVGGVPVANAPQNNVLPNAMPDGDKAKSAAVPAVEAEPTSMTPPAAEPMTRDRPVQLLPREHAATDPSL